jgi:nitroreductase
MDLLEAINQRRSIRRYKKQSLPQGAIPKLLDAARLAPSAGNVQPWQFVVVEHPSTKKEIMTAAFGQIFLEEAAVVIVVCEDETRAEESYGQRGKTLYCIQDTAAAIQNILLTAVSMGLGTCWIGAFSEDKVKKVINAPNGIRVVALIPVGYADESPVARPRRPLSEVMVNERF